MRALFCSAAICGAVLFCSAAIGAEAVKKSAEEVARDVVGQLSREEFAAAEKRFDETMAKAIPVEKLGALWGQLTAQSGKLVRVAGAVVQPAGAFRKVILDAQFERARWQIIVVLAADDRVSGLFVTPAAEGAGAWTPPPYAAKADAIEEREVTVGPLALPGVLTVPRGAGPFPAVVLVHGSGPHDLDETIGPNKPFKDLALGLAARGVASLRYEKRTNAHPEIAAGRITVEEETVADARAALALIAGAAKIDPKRVVLVGHSLGAILAPRIVQKGGAAAVVLMAGSPRAFEQIVLEQVKRNGADAALIKSTEAAAARIRDPKLGPDDVVDLLGAKIRGAYFLDLRAYHAGEAAARLEVPIFVAQGGHDIQVVAADFDAWKAALQNRPRVRFKLYPQLTHLFTPGDGNQADYARASHVAPEWIDDLAAFVKEAR